MNAEPGDGAGPRPVIAGNWKMNHGPAETREFLRRFRPPSANAKPTLVLFPPAVSLPAAREALAGSARVELGVQNIHWERSGALTGELSAEMAAEAGAAYALVGHSERRHRFGETDDETRLKLEAAGRAELVPVLCVGETLEEREAGRVREVVSRQIDAVAGALRGLPLHGRDAGSSTPPAFLVAYEPVWAIGTGRTATPSDATQAHRIVRERLAATIGVDAARSVPVLYGGSVKPENAAELLAAPDVDGLLVGGASLDPESFAKIVAAAG
jgi:triosephosphate isomerase